MNPADPTPGSALTRHDPADPASTALRIVVLTIGGRYGVRILHALRERALIPAAVVIEAHTALRDCFHARTVMGRLRELPLVPARAAWRHLRPRIRRDLRIGAPLVVTGPLNSPAMRRDLTRLRPDLLILAGTRIVSQEILAVPRLATINVHLGLLPWVRGNDVIAHSILEEIPVGATCHLVDRGIDTGPMLVRRLLDVRHAETSLAALEERTTDLGVTLMADAVATIVKSRGLPPATAQTERFPLHRFLPAERRWEADALIRGGAANILFEQWLPRVVPGSLDLPPTVALPARRHVPPPTA